MKKIFLALSVSLMFNSVFAMPSQIEPVGERMILVDPRIHQWGAYDANGQLVRSGRATSGAAWCNDIQQPCRTHMGSFRIRSLGSARCKSPSFPLPHGGAPMPYCMYYNEVQAIHGSPNVVKGNISHGCVRVYPGDAKWLRFNFARIGTLVHILPY